MKKVILIIFVLVSLLFSCKKESINNETIKVKWLHIEDTVSHIPLIFVQDSFFFYYDNDNYLSLITDSNNDTIITISKPINNIISVKTHASSMYCSNNDFKVHLNNNIIIKVDGLNYFESNEVNYLNFYTTNQELDSIEEFLDNNAYSTNSIHKNIIYDNDNLISSVHQYSFITPPFITSPWYVYDSMSLSFTNYLNSPYIPYLHPNQLSTSFFYNSCTIPYLNPLYLLGINGYFAYTPNKNLINSIYLSYSINTVAEEGSFDFKYTFFENKVSKIERSSNEITNAVIEIGYY